MLKVDVEVVCVCEDKGEVVFRFVQFGECEIVLMQYFVEDLVCGKMIDIDDMIVWIDILVILVLIKLDFNLV